MAEKQEKAKPLDKMTAKELREMALGIEGILGVHSMNKGELLEAIKEAKGIVDEGTKKDVGNIREIKLQIKNLREKREEARGAGSMEKVDILRRRIGRLKKKTRRLAAGE
ncbi:MAG: Rho termination factor N-terminal domain-containing protein [Deltaproteobacteria bacterium]|nr:Rho termination factor N-terminal domain-containing protein [Deltaproteobacteria bacterium]